MTFLIDPKIMPGVAGRKRFTVNRLGLRGPELPKGSDLYRIVTIGGSTTECLELDDTEQWPQLLMDQLPRSWVANAGVSAATTVDSLVAVRSIPVLQTADAWIFLEGVNDFSDTMAQRGGPSQAALEEVAENRDGVSRRPFYRHLRLYELYGRARLRIRERQDPSRDDETQAVSAFFQTLRLHRRAGRVVALPDLSIGLSEYRLRLEALANECHAHGKRCIFLTQPFLWHDEMDQREMSMIFFGWVGPRDHPDGYVTASDLARGMSAYNATLLDECTSKRWECYDLASAVPHALDYFFDDVHFNERGARFVANYLAEQMKSRPPFSPGR